MTSLLAQLEAELVDMNSPDVPMPKISCNASGPGRALIYSVLEERILVQHSMRPTRVYLRTHEPFGDFVVEDILSAPTSVSWDDEAIPLSIAQRAEWVLRGYSEKRTAYLQGLLHAALEARATRSEMDSCAVDGAAGQTHEVVEDEHKEQEVAEW
ncbi:uncharacterized protein PHACADRAFT_261505 [Phanerochaete carnosa HHB-10118-sp]|uniref:Uncharacterized protein n=1 Tax=Phanerochaete carnosa (strain HHB-10118-sp) TaxID=650164 RepID=K5W193_PHACS|nr:uncharacterized protein PHACADRAFT_261505 [Phanerochaete carnosa HHB-10118-sp]EKM52850.1 hypothetical protein PHACADRAFT_261505 [Phanerochaete carnosa HHB-10118-sp]